MMRKDSNRLPEAVSADSPLLVLAGIAIAAALVGGALTLQQPLYGLAAAYLLAFVIIAWRLPVVGLMLVFAAAPFQNDLAAGGPVKVSLGEFNLALAAVVFLVRNVVLKRSLSLGPIGLPIALYFCVCLFSSARAGFSRDAVVSLLQMAVYLVVAVAVFAHAAPRLRDLRLPLYAFVATAFFLAVVAIATGSGFVLGIHKNGIGASEACALVICLELWFSAREKEEKWLLAVALAFVAGGLIISLSRGAWVGALGGFIVLAGLRRQFRLLFQSLAVLIPIVAVFWLALPPEKQEYATSFDPSLYNIRARLNSIDFARERFESQPAFGVGVGLRKQFDATNLIWTALAETGIVGLTAFLAIHGAILSMIGRMRALVPLSDERFPLIALAAALVVNSFLHGLVDHYWSRGSLMVTWAAVGMAVGVHASLFPKKRWREAS